MNIRIYCAFTFIIIPGIRGQDVETEKKVTKINDKNVKETKTNIALEISDELANETIPEVPERNIYGGIINKTTFCAGKICIRKCCRKGYVVKLNSEAVNSANCTKNFNKTEVMNPILYNEDMIDSKKKAKDVFTFIDGEIIMNNGFYVSQYMNLYLLETGVLVVKSPNVYEMHRIALDNDHFCMDYVLPFQSNKLIVDGLAVLPGDEEDEETQDPILTISGMYVSSVFLAITLGVYSFLPQLRNLHGKVLMAYVTSMLVGFFTMGTIQLTGVLEVNTSEVCNVLAIFCYFSILATFFWMNVMSFDIYWTFRGIAKARDINRRGENHKFLMYCLYGFGCPLAMTIIFALLNYLPMSEINPYIITPGIAWKGCFLIKMERMFYLYAPMSVLIVANCVLFVATTWNLCQVRRATRSLRAVDSAVQRSTQNRFILYVKVFMLMGLSWSLEVVSSFSPQWTVWKFTDTFNLLIGVTIFVIFVCKKKVFKLLTKRYQHLRGRSPSEVRSRFSRSGSSGSTSTSTSLDQETFHSEVVNLNPKGHHR